MGFYYYTSLETVSTNNYNVKQTYLFVDPFSSDNLTSQHGHVVQPKMKKNPIEMEYPYPQK